ADLVEIARVVGAGEEGAHREDGALGAVLEDVESGAGALDEGAIEIGAGGAAEGSDGRKSADGGVGQDLDVLPAVAAIRHNRRVAHMLLGARLVSIYRWA